MRSAFVEWSDPPPKMLAGHQRGGPKVHDSAMLAIDLSEQPGQWALTDYATSASGNMFVRWCKTRGIRAEHTSRGGVVYLRVLERPGREG